MSLFHNKEPDLKITAVKPPAQGTSSGLGEAGVWAGLTPLLGVASNKDKT